MVRFDESEASGSDTPPAGTYLLEIVDCEAKRSKGGSGPWMLSWRLKIVAGEHAGSVLFDIAMLGGPGAGMGKAKAKAFGILLEQDRDVEVADFVGLRANGHCVHEEYQGRVNLKVNAKAGKHCGYDGIGESGVVAKFDENDPALDAIAGAKASEPDDLDIPFAILLPMMLALHGAAAMFA